MGHGEMLSSAASSQATVLIRERAGIASRAGTSMDHRRARARWWSLLAGGRHGSGSQRTTNTPLGRRPACPRWSTLSSATTAQASFMTREQLCMAVHGATCEERQTPGAAFSGGAMAPDRNARPRLHWGGGRPVGDGQHCPVRPLLK